MSTVSLGPFQLESPIGNGLCANGVSGCSVTCLRSCASLAPCLEVVDGS